MLKQSQTRSKECDSPLYWPHDWQKSPQEQTIFGTSKTTQESYCSSIVKTAFGLSQNLWKKELDSDFGKRNVLKKIW